MKLWIKRDDLTHVSDLDHYVFTMAKNRIVDHFRRVRLERSYRDDLLFTLKNQSPKAIEQLTEEDFKSRLHLLLDELPPRQKEIFQLSRLEGLSHDEIAIQLNISNKTVRNHLFEALKFLRERMKSDKVMV